MNTMIMFVFYSSAWLLDFEFLDGFIIKLYGDTLPGISAYVIYTVTVVWQFEPHVSGLCCDAKL